MFFFLYYSISMNTNREFWMSITELINYEVSDQGRVRNIQTGRILKGRNNGNGYLTVNIRNKKNKFQNFYIHRLVGFAFLIDKKKKGQNCIDHIIPYKADNRACNLRWCTALQNSWNKPKITRENYGNGSIYKGVRKVGENFTAQITDKGKLISLGSFETEIEAAQIYNLIAERIFGEYAKLNQIDDSKL